MPLMCLLNRVWSAFCDTVVQHVFAIVCVFILLYLCSLTLLACVALFFVKMADKTTSVSGFRL